MKVKSRSAPRLTVWACAMILIALAVWMKSGWSRVGLIDAVAMLIVGLSLLGGSQALTSGGRQE